MNVSYYVTMADVEINVDKDLPLMANASDIRIRHYMFRFEFDLVKKFVSGTALVFLDPLTDVVKDFDFEVVLDARHLFFESVSQVECDPDEVDVICKSFSKRRCYDTFKLWFDRLDSNANLNFKTEPWCLRISKAGVKCAAHFPRVVRIQYVTMPEAASLFWRCDRAQQPCVFTPASAVNNRSLFPCQEPPIAMATWQCVIVADADAVLCTGDHNGLTVSDNPHHHYFYTQMVLPMSTYAVAIGNWSIKTIVSLDQCSSSSSESRVQCRQLHEPYPCHIQRGDSGPLLPCRIIGPPDLVEMTDSDNNNWTHYLPACLEASYQLLGSHPFAKLDVVILPRCYSGLGLASPSLMFVSQSVVINGDLAMNVRLAHEISHSWFGLVIGALDWTEEWLSEGFATFAEDHIHKRAMDILNDKRVDWNQVSELRALIRYQTLCAELEATPSDHQVMRPMGGNQLRDESANVAYVKNGQNPEMAYTQVHYVKGYFLLRHFCDCVGTDEFFTLLRHYIHELYHGRLVHSTDFLALFYTSCPRKFAIDKSQENVQKICSSWLDTNELPLTLVKRFDELQTNPSPLLLTVGKVFSFWHSLNNFHFTRKRKAPDKNQQFVLESLLPEQLVLLMEKLLSDVNNMHKKTLLELNSTYNFDRCNADVQHRWCELIVKHRYMDCLSDVATFLVEHQAMGIYLYGEMAISGNKRLCQMAKDIFQLIKTEMDPGMVANVQEMLYGSIT